MQCYYFDSDNQWLLMTAEPEQALQARCFMARDIAAIAIDDYQSSDSLRAAKRLMRLALAPLLGDKPLSSKSLFVKTT
jgi:DNA repair protein RecO (recombination protein O)